MISSKLEELRVKFEEAVKVTQDVYHCSRRKSIDMVKEYLLNKFSKKEQK
ncbi:MAG: hypothetical protein ACFFAU_01570 [Candidatus Hodarchaeota archaeon]